MRLSDDIRLIKGVGLKNEQSLKSLGIHNIGNLINIFPKKYIDYTKITSISRIRPGNVSFKAKFKIINSKRVRRGLHITEAIAYDKNSSVKVVWFNQPYREKNLKKNIEYLINGKFELSNNRLQIINPSVELNDDISGLKYMVVPVYSQKYGIRQNLIAKLLKNAFEDELIIDEILPDIILNDFNLIPRDQALKEIHFPSNKDLLNKAINRMGFEEIYILMLASHYHRKLNEKSKSPTIKFDLKLVKDFINQLPFQLTNSQKKVLWQIYQDIEKEEPANRLIEGDVGSGKTIVAAMAGLMAIHQNFKVAFVAPTEILASQHYETIYHFFKGIGYEANIKLLTSSTSKKEKMEIIKLISTKKPFFLIGTHALIQQNIKWINLGLLIIDEQHRFGVEQRQAIIKNSNTMPHVILLTATPIPRTLALTLYGELSISRLEARNNIEQRIQSEIVSPNSLKRVFDFTSKQVEQGRQVYVVCPVVKDSGNKSLNSVEYIYEFLRKGPFSEFSIGFIHGKLKSDEKDTIMLEYKKRKIDILVSTTVIEVGIDVPNATVIIIFDANRFGLAQLHQLRGRVGRGQYKGYCFLVNSDSLKPSKRLIAMENSTNGYELAELDLEIRGPGAIYGTLQHGALDLNFANINDINLLKKVKSAVDNYPEISDNMVKYDELRKKVSAAGKLLFFN